MKRRIVFTALLSLLSFLPASCEEKAKAGTFKEDQKVDPQKHEIISLGGGCYWCVEAIFQQLDGVISTTSGFMGGHIPDPTYEQVTQGFTGHIEVIQVAYDPEKISTEKILEWFWKAHDPTNPKGQGHDIGERYTSNIFAHSAKHKKIAEASKKAAQKNFDKPIATKIRDAGKFYKAKEDHQDYYFRNKDQNRYCPAVITPKLKKLNLDH